MEKDCCDNCDIEFGKEELNNCYSTHLEGHLCLCDDCFVYYVSELPTQEDIQSMVNKRFLKSGNMN